MDLSQFTPSSALIPLFVVEALALGRQWTGYGLLVSALIQGLLLLPAGRMADTRGRKPALILGTAATTIGFVVLAFTNSLGLFLVARTGQDTYSAMSALCTHERCDVTGFSSGRFICPCHGSTFTSSGAVVTGPAPRGLQTYTTQVTGGVLSFSV